MSAFAGFLIGWFAGLAFGFLVALREIRHLVGLVSGEDSGENE